MSSDDSHLIEVMTQREELFRGRFLHAFRDQVRLPDGSSSDRTAYAKNIAVQVDEWRRQNDIPFDMSTIAARPADTDGGEFDTMDEALRYLYTCLNFPDSVLC